MKNFILGLLLISSTQAFAGGYDIPLGAYDCDGGSRVNIYENPKHNGNILLGFYAGGSRGTFLSYSADIKPTSPADYVLEVEGFDGTPPGTGTERPVLQGRLSSGFVYLKPYNSQTETFSFVYQEARVTYHSYPGHLDPLWDTFNWEKSYPSVEGCKRKIFQGCAGGNCN